MNEMTKPTTNRPWRRKLLLAAGLLLGFMLVGSGICVAAGINPFRTFTVFMDGNNNLIVTDENGNTVSNDLVDVQVNETNGTKELTITVNGDQTKSGTTTHTTTTTTVVPK